MDDDTVFWHEKIHEVMPDLEIHSLRHHSEGLVNDVLIVNDAWVIRFASTEWGQELMRQEHQLIELLQPHLSLTIPSPRLVEKNALIYPYFHSVNFSRQIWICADASHQQLLANQLGEFLRELHNIPYQEANWQIPHALVPSTQETWLDIYDQIIQKVQPMLLPHQVEWMETLFNHAFETPGFFDYDPVMVHGDLVPYHIVYHPAEKRINAVLDFLTAGIGDPATDLASLIYHYGERLVSKMAVQYPAYDSIIERARFFAQALDLQWALLGIESGEFYWFTAHLGGARDIWSDRD